MSRPLAAVALATLVALAAAPGAEAKRGPKLTVMTQNLYLGSGLIAAATAPDRPTFEQRTATLWNNVQATAFPPRAKVLARLIKRANPDLVGLQEVTTWYRGPNGVKDGPATKSTAVVYDFLRSLLRQLNRGRGPKYRAVASDGLASDVEAPTALGFDIRFRLGNVILAKRERGLRIRRASFRTYASQFSITTPGGPFAAKRAWVAADVSFKGRRFRFVDTHLESEVPPTRLQQANELVSRAGPLRVKGQKILVGDLNSDPRGRTGDAPDSYNAVVRARFSDAWARAGRGLGFTANAPNNELLRSPIPLTYRERIDFVLTKPGLKPSRVTRLGLKRSDRTPGGLWPSDHAGVVATYRLR